MKSILPFWGSYNTARASNTAASNRDADEPGIGSKTTGDARSTNRIADRSNDRFPPPVGSNVEHNSSTGTEQHVDAPLSGPKGTIVPGTNDGSPSGRQQPNTKRSPGKKPLSSPGHSPLLKKRNYGSDPSSTPTNRIHGDGNTVPLASALARNNVSTTKTTGKHDGGNESRRLCGEFDGKENCNTTRSSTISILGRSNKKKSVKFGRIIIDKYKIQLGGHGVPSEPSEAKYEGPTISLSCNLVSSVMHDLQPLEPSNKNQIDDLRESLRDESNKDPICQQIQNKIKTLRTLEYKNVKNIKECAMLRKELRVREKSNKDPNCQDIQNKIEALRDLESKNINNTKQCAMIRTSRRDQTKNGDGDFDHDRFGFLRNMGYTDKAGPAVEYTNYDIEQNIEECRTIREERVQTVNDDGTIPLRFQYLRELGYTFDQSNRIINQGLPDLAKDPIEYNYRTQNLRNLDYEKYLIKGIIDAINNTAKNTTSTTDDIAVFTASANTSAASSTTTCHNDHEIRGIKVINNTSDNSTVLKSNSHSTNNSPTPAATTTIAASVTTASSTATNTTSTTDDITVVTARVSAASTTSTSRCHSSSFLARIAAETVYPKILPHGATSYSTSSSMTSPSCNNDDDGNSNDRYHRKNNIIDNSNDAEVSAGVGSPVKKRVRLDNASSEKGDFDSTDTSSLFWTNDEWSQSIDTTTDSNRIANKTKVTAAPDKADRRKPTPVNKGSKSNGTSKKIEQTWVLYKDYEGTGAFKASKRDSAVSPTASISTRETTMGTPITKTKTSAASSIRPTATTATATTTVAATTAESIDHEATTVDTELRITPTELNKGSGTGRISVTTASQRVPSYSFDSADRSKNTIAAFDRGCVGTASSSTCIHDHARDHTDKKRQEQDDDDDESTGTLSNVAQQQQQQQKYDGQCAGKFGDPSEKSAERLDLESSSQAAAVLSANGDTTNPTPQPTPPLLNNSRAFSTQNMTNMNATPSPITAAASAAAAATATIKQCCTCAIITDSMSCEQAICACWKAAQRCTDHCCNYKHNCSNRSGKSTPAIIDVRSPNGIPSSSTNTSTVVDAEEGTQVEEGRTPAALGNPVLLTATEAGASTASGDDISSTTLSTSRCVKNGSSSLSPQQHLSKKAQPKTMEGNCLGGIEQDQEQQGNQRVIDPSLKSPPTMDSINSPALAGSSSPQEPPPVAPPPTLSEAEDVATKKIEGSPSASTPQFDPPPTPAAVVPTDASATTTTDPHATNSHKDAAALAGSTLSEDVLTKKMEGSPSASAPQFDPPLTPAAVVPTDASATTTTTTTHPCATNSHKDAATTKKKEGSPTMDSINSPVLAGSSSPQRPPPVAPPSTLSEDVLTKKMEGSPSASAPQFDPPLTLAAVVPTDASATTTTTTTDPHATNSHKDAATTKKKEGSSSTDPRKLQEFTNSTHDTRNINEEKNGTTTVSPVPLMLEESKKNTRNDRLSTCAAVMDGTEDTDRNRVAVPVSTPVPSSNNEGTGISTGAVAVSKKNTNQNIVPPGTATEQQHQHQQDNFGSATTAATNTEKEDDKENEQSQAKDTKNYVNNGDDKSDKDDNFGSNAFDSHDDDDDDDDDEEEKRNTISKDSIRTNAKESKGPTSNGGGDGSGSHDDEEKEENRYTASNNSAGIGTITESGKDGDNIIEPNGMEVSLSELQREKRGIPSNNSADIGNENITGTSKDAVACIERHGSETSLEELQHGKDNCHRSNIATIADSEAAHGDHDLLTTAPATTNTTGASGCSDRVESRNNHGLNDSEGKGGYDDDDDAKNVEIMVGKNEVGLVAGGKPSNVTDKTSIEKNQEETLDRNTSTTIVFNLNQNTLETTESLTSTECTDASLRKLYLEVEPLCVLLIDSHALGDFRHFETEDLTSNVREYPEIALQLGTLDRSMQSNNRNDYEPTLNTITKLLHQLGVRDHRGMIRELLDLIQKTTTNRNCQPTILSEHVRMRTKRSEFQIVLDLMGCWDAGETVVEGTWKKQNIIYVSGDAELFWETNVINNGDRMYLVVRVILRNDKNEFVTLTRAHGPDLQNYQIDGKGEPLTWRELYEKYAKEGYGVFLMWYKFRMLTDDEANRCGGYREKRKAKQRSVVGCAKSNGKRDRFCFPAVLTRLFNYKGIKKDKKGNEYGYDTFEDGFKSLKDVGDSIKDGSHNINVADVKYFLGKKGGDPNILGETNVGRFNLAEREDRFIKHKDKVNQGPTYNKIFAQQEGEFIINVSYCKKNAAKAPAENRHVLLFCGKERNSYVCDRDKEYEITWDEGADDATMQLLLQDFWGDDTQKYEIVNVWEIQDKHIKKKKK